MLAQTVREAAERFGPAVAFHDPDGGTLTFADLDRRSDALAAALARDGVGPGARVALRLASTSHYVLVYAAAAKLGAVTAGISPVLAPAEQDALVDLVDPAVVVDSADAVDEYIRRGERRAPPPPLAPDQDRPVAIVFTSGTTGRPKAAMFAQRQLRAATAIDTGGRWATEAGQATLASTQFAHVGFMTKLPWYLRGAGCARTSRPAGGPGTPWS
ncbi:AMP-binding protein [Frankia sp. AgKG'84/4]|uniref:AMP-binding protein n=1 Tax=Frankia sp. AgKG'84/4 TaxID=573490 RepID=UPI00200C5989|nr:class I adenylate-forming enzyme family protein [Frankia sp. AgKG'84/4]MCL9794002.1 acyl--CoA ligase [Frankia sp. AgKG'84/4]